MLLVGGRGATLAFLALAAFVSYGQTASLNSQPIPTKDKKSPEVIYYERAADESRIDKRLDKAAPAEPAAWPSFRSGGSDSRVRATPAIAGSKNRQPYGSPVGSAATSGSRSRGGGDAVAAAAADSDGKSTVAGFVDKSLLAEALMQMLIEELDEGGGAIGAARGDGGRDVAEAPESVATDDLGYDGYEEADGESVVDDNVAGDAEEAEYNDATAMIQAPSAADRVASASDAVERGNDFAAAAAAARRGPSSLGQAANLAAAGATPRRGQRPPPSADAPKAAQLLQTTAAAVAADATAAEREASDGDDDDDQSVLDGIDASVAKDDKDDSREDKRVRVEVSGGVQPRPPQSSVTDSVAAGARYGGKVEPAKSDKDGDDRDGDPYREYLDMWYKANIAEDYEEDSLERLRNYLEYMKLSKNRSGSEKKPRAGSSSSAAAAAAGSSATSRNGKVTSTSSTSGGRKKRSLTDDGSLLVYDAPQQPVGVLPADGVYLTSSEAARLRQFIIDLNEQNNKYEAALRSVLAADDDSERELEERTRFASAVDRSRLSAAGEERNKNLYRLAYGLADPYRRRIGY